MTCATALSPGELAESITGRPYLSWSQIQGYQLCPRAFAFKYVEKAEPEFTPSSLVFGAALHEAISIHNEAVLEGRPTPDVELLKEVVRDELMPLGPPLMFGKGEDVDGLIELADRMIRSFLVSEESKPSTGETIVGIEEAVTEHIDPELPAITARIDLVTLSCEGVVVTDYKSTRTSWPAGKAEEQAGQLHLYGKLTAGTLDEGARIAGLRFITITKGKKPKVRKHPVSLDDSRLEATIEQIREVWHGIVEGVFPARPGWPCKSCPFRRQCPSAVL